VGRVKLTVVMMQMFWASGSKHGEMLCKCFLKRRVSSIVLDADGELLREI
jgi:hypothetical protein